MKHLLQILLDWAQPVRFDRYCPARRLGTRRLEERMLRSLHGNLPAKGMLSS